MPEYGMLGRDVGTVGRWLRLFAGLVIIVMVTFDFIGGSHVHTLRTNVLIVVFFLGFGLVYSAVYATLAGKLPNLNPWLTTLIFVFPAVYISVINGFLVPYELSLGYWLGLPNINHPLTVAMLLYIGISFPVQFFSRYGGCEVIAIQNLVFKKECVSYCVPLLPIDIIERAVVNARVRRKERGTGG